LVAAPEPTSLSSQTAFEAQSAARADSKGKALESPLARFTRLSVEVKELENDLALLADGAEQRKHAALVDAAQEAELDEVMRGLATLQSNLSAMEQNARFQPFLLQRGGGSGGGGGANYGADAALALQKDLTARFFQQIDALKRAQQGVSSSGGDAPIVYEIYSSGDLNAVDRDAKSRVAALETRLVTLEKAVGSFQARQSSVDGLSAALSLSGGDLAGESSAADISSVVALLEKRVGLLNEKNLDAIKTRTTALVHELTLLGKLKEAPGVQGALTAQADRDKLQQTYDALSSVTDVAAAVPALVDRLVSLKAVHDDTLQVNQRVQRLERSHESLAELLESDAAVLANVSRPCMLVACRRN
jgi:dynactin-2